MATGWMPSRTNTRRICSNKGKRVLVCTFIYVHLSMRFCVLVSVCSNVFFYHRVLMQLYVRVPASATWQENGSKAEILPADLFFVLLFDFCLNSIVPSHPTLYALA